MKNRISYIVSLFCLIFFVYLGIFLCIQKPIFIVYNTLRDRSVNFMDILKIWHNGITLDLATASYFSIIPLIILCIGGLSVKDRFKKHLKIYLAFSAVVLSLACITDTVLYEFWMFKLDATILMYINDPKNAVASVSYLYVLKCVGSVVLLSILSYHLLIFPLQRIAVPTNKGKSILVLAVFLLGGTFLFVMIRGIRIWPNTPTRAYFCTDSFLNHSAVNPIYNMIYSLSKMNKFDNEFQYFSEEECKDGFMKLFPKSDGETENLFNSLRPNILLIALEGMGACFVESLNGIYPEVAPNISRLSKEGINFTRCYCSSFRTDRGIVSLLSGYPGQPTSSIMRFSHKIKSLPGIPKSLKKLGYDTQVLYSGDVSFFNMFEYFMEVGHSKIISEDNFPKELRTANWGVHDEYAFDWLLNDIQDRQDKSGRPWYITMLTISSHEPFDVPYHKLEDEKLNAFAYTDSCFNVFIEKLKLMPIWNNLLVVVTADHGYNFRQIDAPDFPHIPFFILGGAIRTPMTVDKIMNQTDIAATLLAQLGSDYQEFKFSRNIMSNSFVYPFSFSTYNNGFNFRDSAGVTVYDNTSQMPLHGNNNDHIRKGKILLQTIYKDLDDR